MTDNTNYIIINSTFRRNKDSTESNDFIYELGEVVEVKEIAIKSISIVNAEYNVKESNKKLIVNNGVADSILLFPVGQYTITSLMAELQSLLTTTYGGTVTVTQNAVNKKVEITSTTPIRFRTNQTDSPMSHIIGLGDNGYEYPEFTQTTILAPFLPNLQGANNYHIVSNTLSQGQGSLLRNNNKQPIIVSVPVNVDFGEVIQYEVSEIDLNKKTFSRPVNVQDIDIRVYDDDNELVDLNGTPVEIVVQIIKSSVLPFSFQGTKMM